ncbi:PLP-dependent aminotransferase family protein [Candidatus Albibeggiatoa sp. nov. NOAA]|uniref:MocR-like pyridoxine biosynthesis transcription factor PdxR n=1 Tax=Candidatus Albibeggiatoa sp. nov. NOAA TaxID=3162724 RepID=UPI0033051A57|nr:PLP-dependent aminotransferase family protein [Thiotrichaceae bacterium]
MELPDLHAIQLNPQRNLQTQIHQHIVEWICSGRLPATTKLPSSRQLAQDLGVSRNTICLVFDQLKSEGFIETYQGKGVYVATELPVRDLSAASPQSKTIQALPTVSKFAQSLQKDTFTDTTLPLPFTLGIPDLSAFPTKIWQQIQRLHHNRVSLMGYDSYRGFKPLRQAIAAYLRLSRGVHCDAEQIIITQGAQQAISLCAQILLDEDDTVFLENPGYLGARQALRSNSIQPVPLRDQCVDVDFLYQSKGKLLYATPTHQYPLGGVLSAGQRLKLIDWAASQQAWIIEDDYDSEFYFNHKPITALQGMTESNTVIYLGSFSKTLFPALRVGYLVVPKQLIDVFAQAKSFMTGESPLLNQAVISDFITEGHFTRHLRKMRKLYKQKWLHFDQLIHEKLFGIATPIAESAGMHLVIEIPNIDDKKLQQHLLQNGFGGSELSRYYIGDAEKTGLVLGFANTTETQRVKCVELIQAYLT